MNTSDDVSETSFAFIRRADTPKYWNFIHLRSLEDKKCWQYSVNKKQKSQ
jgi:hypothetical protein